MTIKGGPLLSKASVAIHGGNLLPSHSQNLHMFNLRDAIVRRLFLNSVKQQCNLGLSKIDHALSIFRRMISLNPLPSIVDFNCVFTAISKMKPYPRYSIIISLSRELELSRVRPNKHSLGILANCYCRLCRVDFAFSLLGKRLKLGYEPDIVIFTTLINGLINADDVNRAVKLLDKVVKLGFQPNIVTYGAMIKGLCKAGNNAGAFNLLRKMQGGLCKPDVVIYSTIIDGLCKDNLLPQALEVFAEMQNEGISPNVVTYSALVRGCCNGGR